MGQGVMGRHSPSGGSLPVVVSFVDLRIAVDSELPHTPFHDVQGAPDGGQSPMRSDLHSRFGSFEVLRMTKRMERGRGMWEHLIVAVMQRQCCEDALLELVESGEEVPDGLTFPNDCYVVIEGGPTQIPEGPLCENVARASTRAFVQKSPMMAINRFCSSWCNTWPLPLGLNAVAEWKDTFRLPDVPPGFSVSPVGIFEAEERRIRRVSPVSTDPDEWLGIALERRTTTAHVWVLGTARRDSARANPLDALGFLLDHEPKIQIESRLAPDTEALSLVKDLSRWYARHIRGGRISSPGRPPNTGYWSSGDEFRTAVLFALRLLNKRSSRPSQQDVADIFTASSIQGLPTPPCSDRQIRAWLRRYGLNWQGLLDQTTKQ